MMRPSLVWQPFRLGAALAFFPLAAMAGEDACVIALGGSVTEIAVALGAEDLFVARDTTSNYPESVTGLPDVGYIRARSPENVLALDPGLILAEGDAGPPEAVEVLKAAETRAASVAHPKRVLFILSLQGGRVLAGGEGTEAEGIIRLAGGINAGTGFQGYKPMTDEAVLTATPDVILMMDREGALAIADADVLAQPALAATPAGQSRRIVRMDGMLMLGFGPRRPAAADVLYTDLYGSGG